MFYVKKEYNGYYDICDTEDSTVETIDRATLINLVQNGLSIYGVSKSFRVTTFKNEHDIVRHYIMRCELSGKIAPEFKITKVGNRVDISLIRQEEEYRVVIPEIATSISDYCFKFCKFIHEVEIPAGVKEIGAYCFYHCTNLEKVKFADGIILNKIPVCCFCETGITSIELPESVELIDTMAFCGCSNLVSFKAPKNLKVIGLYAFDNTEFSRMGIPDSLRALESRELGGID